MASRGPDLPSASTVSAPDAGFGSVAVAFAVRLALAAGRARSVGKIGLQAVPATLAAVSGLLVATERRGRVELVEGVRPHHARAQLVGDGEDPRPLLRPDAGRQAVRRVVGLL